MRGWFGFGAVGFGRVAGLGDGWWCSVGSAGAPTLAPLGCPFSPAQRVGLAGPCPSPLFGCGVPGRFPGLRPRSGAAVAPPASPTPSAAAAARCCPCPACRGAPLHQLPGPAVPGPSAAPHHQRQPMTRGRLRRPSYQLPVTSQRPPNGQESSPRRAGAGPESDSRPHQRRADGHRPPRRPGQSQASPRNRAENPKPHVRPVINCDAPPRQYAAEQHQKHNKHLSFLRFLPFLSLYPCPIH